MCRDCVGSRCVDCPSPSEPVELVCPDCEEKGCERCGKRGRLTIDGCPKRLIGGDLATMLGYAALYEQGLPPVAGGALDQSRWFIDAFEAWSHDRALVRAQLGR